MPVYFKQNTTDSDACRFSMVCAHCSNGCETPSTVEVDNMNVPVCRTIPKGVNPLSPSMTVADLDLENGYFRFSIESANVLECYQPDACGGGIDATNYCKNGYEGPCKWFATDVLGTVSWKHCCSRIRRMYNQNIVIAWW